MFDKLLDRMKNVDLKEVGNAIKDKATEGLETVKSVDLSKVAGAVQSGVAEIKERVDDLTGKSDLEEARDILTKIVSAHGLEEEWPKELSDLLNRAKTFLAK